MSYHNNNVYLAGGLDLYDSRFTIAEEYGGAAQYTVKSYSVTPGQDPDGHVWVNQEHNLYPGGFFSFFLGRKGNEDVASWWSNNIKASENTFQHNPGELNFAFLGTLTVTFWSFEIEELIIATFPNVGIAQGHAGGSNNWWFGGQGGWSTQSNRIRLLGWDVGGGDVTMEFERGGNDVDWVYITDIILPSY